MRKAKLFRIHSAEWKAVIFFASYTFFLFSQDSFFSETQDGQEKRLLLLLLLLCVFVFIFLVVGGTVLHFRARWKIGENENAPE